MLGTLGCPALEAGPAALAEGALERAAAAAAEAGTSTVLADVEQAEETAVVAAAAWWMIGPALGERGQWWWARVQHMKEQAAGPAVPAVAVPAAASGPPPLP